MSIKNFNFITLIGVIGSFISNLFGGWNEAMTTLVIFMGVDLITGWILAGVFHKSKKSETGALSSKASLEGLVRKGMILLAVLIAARLDLVLSTQYIRTAVIIAFIANETLSITENMGLMGVPIPAAITKAIELLKKESEEKK